MGKRVKAALETLDRVTQPRRLRAVMYLRVSTEEQVDGYGIEDAEKRCARYIERQETWDLVGRYADEGISGSLPAEERPHLLRLMNDAEAGQFDVVVVGEGRAIGRTDRAYWPWVWALEDKGIFVADARLGIDNTTDAGREQMREEANYAFKEWTRIRSRTQGGLQGKAEDGGAVGAPPFGWYIENKGVKRRSRYALQEREHATLKRGRELVVQYLGDVSKATAALNAEGLLTRSGVPWSRENLRARLTSDATLNARIIWRNPDGEYTKTDRDGKPTYGRTVVIDLPPAFTPEEVAELKQALAMGTKVRAPREGTELYPLSKRMTAPCGQHYRGGKATTTQQRKYRCGGKYKPAPGAETCDCSELNADAVETAVWARLTQFLSDPEALRAQARNWVGIADGLKVNHADRLEELDKKIGIQQRALATIMTTAAIQAAEAGMNPEQSAALVAETAKGIKQQLARLAEERAQAAAWQAEADQAESRARDLESLARMARTRLPELTPAERARVLHLLDIKIQVEANVSYRDGNPCPVIAWFQAQGRPVPLGVSDAAWSRIEPLVTKSKGTKRTAPHREVIEAFLAKARTGARWIDLDTPGGYAPKSLSGRWLRWQPSGLWAQVVEQLDGEAVPPAGAPALVPPMQIRGGFVPSQMLAPASSPANGGVQHGSAVNRQTPITFQLSLAA
jgi:DNA invertase Pin-like site-specific DNA recombinase